MSLSRLAIIHKKQMLSIKEGYLCIMHLFSYYPLLFYILCFIIYSIGAISMSKKAIYILSFLLFSSCTVLSDYRYSTTICNADIYYYNFGDINSHYDIAQWIRHNIRYVHTSKMQSPKSTISTGEGGCLAKAVLYINMAYVCLDIKMSLIAVRGRSVVNGGFANHAAVIYDGVSFDVQTGLSKQYDIGYIYCFDEIFNN